MLDAEFSRLRKTSHRAGRASSPSKPRPARQRGFSLLELMVTLAVGAVILTMGVPSFSTVTKNANIVGAANTFLTDLRYTRDIAIMRNQRVVMCPSASGAACDTADWARGWIVFVDADADGALDAGEPIQRVGSALSRLALQTGQFANAITYRPNGRAMGAAVANNFGAFLMCDDRGGPHARGIIIDFGGRPRVTHLATLGINPACPPIA